MGRGCRRAALLSLLVALPAMAAAPPAHPPAQPAASAPETPPPAAASPGGTLGTSNGPVEITSDDSLEMEQSNKVYIARGNAVAKRADRTIYGDVLDAYYRDIPNSNQTEIWRIVADGHVRITTPTQNAVGDHGVYDLDTKIAILTGKTLELTTPQDVVTARDSLEWYDDKQLAVARGNALAIRNDRRIRADVLAAQVSTAPGEAQRISRVDAEGHVLVAGPTQIGTGDRGVYNVDTGVATLIGHVTLARGENTLRGQYGVVDLRHGVSRLLPGIAADQQRGRVQGYIIPRKRTQPEAALPGKPATPPGPAATPAPAAGVAPSATSQIAEPVPANSRY